MADRISSLHDSILYHIISCLSIKDLAKTKVLSKRWNELGFSLPCIELENFESLTHEKSFVEFVDKLLLNYDKSTKLIKFRLSTYYNSHHVREWVASAITAGVEELELELHTRDKYNTSLPWGLFEYRWPYLRHFSLDCNSLVSLNLELHGNQAYYLRFFCLPKLKRMQLYKVLLSHNFIHQIYNSPNLEYLSLRRCQIDVVSSSLLTVEDLKADVHMLRNLFSLNDVHIDLTSHIDNGSNSHFLSKFMRRLVNVETLSLSKGSTMFLGRSYLVDYLPTFCNLKHLKIKMGACVEEIRVMAGLLKCSPILNSLDIEFYYLEYWYVKKDLTPLEFPPLWAPKTLKLIRMDHFRASQNQYELVRLFLVSAKSVENFIVKVDEHAQDVEKDELDSTEWDYQVYEVDDDGVVDFVSVRDELLKFPRSNVLKLFRN